MPRTANVKDEESFVAQAAIVHRASRPEHLLPALTRLAELRFPLTSVTHQEANKLLGKLCSISPCKLVGGSKAFCSFVRNLVHGQQVELDQDVLDKVLYILVNQLRAPEPAEGVRADQLWAIGAVTYNKGHRCAKVYVELLGRTGLLMPYAVPSCKCTESNRAAIHCIGSLCARPPGPRKKDPKGKGNTLEPLLPSLVLVLLETLQHTGAADMYAFCKTLCTTFRAMGQVVEKAKSVDTRILPALLAVIKLYMFYGLPGVEDSVPPTDDASRRDVAIKLTTKQQNISYDPLARLIVAPFINKSAGHTAGGAADAAGAGPERPQAGSSSTSWERGKSLSSARDSGSSGGEGGESVRHGSVRKRSSSGLVPRVLSGGHGYNSSESEFSDFPSYDGRKATGERHIPSSRVRQAAFHCAQIVIRSAPKQAMNGYWQSFIPSGTVMQGATSATIFTSMMLEPTPKGRVAAIGVLADLLDGSKQFLAQASESAKDEKQSFKSFSSTLTAMIRQAHAGLEQSLRMERAPLPLTHGLKCLALLVANTPYPRLMAGHLSRIADLVTPFLAHANLNVQSAAMCCAKEMLGIETPPPGDLIRLILGDATASCTVTKEGKKATPSVLADGGGSAAIPGDVPAAGESASKEPAGTLLDAVIGVATSHADGLCSGGGAGTEAANLAIATISAGAIDALSSFVQAHNFTTPAMWTTLITFAQAAAGNQRDLTVRLAATKLLGFLGKGLSLDNIQGETEAARTTRTKLADIFWSDLLESLLTTLLEDPAPAIRISACDCVSFVGKRSFAALPSPKRIVCQTLVMGLTLDDVTAVKAAASRALGVLVLYPELRDDMNFVMDVATYLVEVITEKALPTRTRASWALGNLADSLVIRREVVPEPEPVPTKLLGQLLDAALKSSKDSDKVKPNAMRSLGGLGRIIGQEYLKTSEGPAMVSAIAAELITNLKTGAVKVRWNAACALGVMLRNKSLLPTSPWVPTLIKSLTMAVQSAPNFKVRINAAQALAVPESRGFYGPFPHLAQIVETLVNALATINDTMADFKEFKYQDSLRTQLVSTLLHVFGVAAVHEQGKLLQYLHHHVTIGGVGDVEVAATFLLEQLLVSDGLSKSLFDDLVGRAAPGILPGQQTWLQSARSQPTLPPVLVDD